MPVNIYEPNVADPYPLLGSRLHQVNSRDVEFETDLWLMRRIKAVQMASGYDALYIVAKPLVVRYRFTNTLPSSKDYGDKRVVVPAGMLTDLSSVPRIAWNIVGPVGKHLEASIVHDFLYIAWQDIGRGAHEDDRLFADNLFRAMMIASGVSSQQVDLIYFTVRKYGWESYAGVNPPPRYVKV